MNPELLHTLKELLPQIQGYIYPNEIEIHWGLLIVVYPYITGVVAGAFILASLVKVFNVKEVQPLYRLSLLTALAYLLVAPIPLVSHLGHPERFYEILLTPDHKALKLITIVGIPSAFLLHGYVGFIFGSIKANPWWSSVLIPIVFLFSAIVSGVALVILLYMVITPLTGGKINMRCVDKAVDFLFYAVIVDFSLELVDFIHRVYQSEEEIQILSEMVMSKLFASLLIIQVLLGMLLPLALISVTKIFKKRFHLSDDLRKMVYFIAVILIQFGIFATRWNVVIGGQMFSKSFRGLTTYKVGFGGIEGLLYTVLLLALPIVILAVLMKILPPWKGRSVPHCGERVSCANTVAFFRFYALKRFSHPPLLDVDPVIAVSLKRGQRRSGASGDQQQDPFPILHMVHVLVSGQDGVHLVALEDLEEPPALLPVSGRGPVGEDPVGPRGDVHRHDEGGDPASPLRVCGEVAVEPREGVLRQRALRVVHDREVGVLVGERVGGAGEAELPGEPLRFFSSVELVVPDHDVNRFAERGRRRAVGLPLLRGVHVDHVPRVEKELHVRVVHGGEDLREDAVLVVPAVAAHRKRPPEGARRPEQGGYDRNEGSCPSHDAILSWLWRRTLYPYSGGHSWFSRR
ncbi:MAG: Polysulfide reductase, NrfD [Deltaproteobacteria bacterium]|nr:Polysulfide reductase, NrfD [Deltaproteobacteria bacterium]